MAQEMLKFKVGDNIVYPTHGVGKITAEETEVIAGSSIELYVITFAENKMIVRVPKFRASTAGLRHLSSKSELQKALAILEKKSEVRAGVMWSKRAQDHEDKINSGNPVEIAKVLRDLHSSDNPEERSYSSRVLYETALNRLIDEYAVSSSITKEQAKQHILDALNNAVVG